jgi:hypothetical protein
VRVRDRARPPQVEQRGRRSEDRGAQLEDLGDRVGRPGRLEDVSPPGEHERLDRGSLSLGPRAPVDDGEAVVAEAEGLHRALGERSRALRKQASHRGVLVVEVTRHLEGVLPDHVHRYPDVRRAQIRDLLGKVTHAADGLAGARESVEDSLDVREGGLKGGWVHGS